ncbi:MAG: hypothetical protein R2865_12750 [Deinococcales bacterium]
MIKNPALTNLKTNSPNAKAWQRFRRHPLALLGLFLFSLICLLALFAPLIERYEPNKINLRDKFQPPSAQHFLGTDRVGRDIWSRTLHGGRISLLVGFAAAAVSMLIGIILGAYQAIMAAGLICS